MRPPISYREAIKEALREELARDERVFVMGEDVAQYGGCYKVTKGLLDEFGPERIRNTPLAEAGIAGTALGAALVGMRPVAEIMYVDFTPIAMSQILNQISKFTYMTGGAVKVPLVIRTQGGAGVSAGPHHSQSLEAFFTHIPGLIVVMPSTPYDAKGLLKSSIREDNPVIFLEGKKLYGSTGDVPEDDYVIPLGKADVKRSGSDLTIVAYSRMVGRVLKVADALAEDGIEAEVIDPRTLIPLDEEVIFGSVRKTSRLLLVQEACKTGGFAAEIAARVAEHASDYLDAPILRVAALDSPVPFSPNLEDAVIPNEERIWAGALQVLGQQPRPYTGERVAEVAAR
jgi:pyruvate/2-oxoglutarate/acetoin dehydrogenase E1 component